MTAIVARATLAILIKPTFIYDFVACFLIDLKIIDKPFTTMFLS